METRTYSATGNRIELEPLRRCNAYIRHFYDRLCNLVYSELVSYCTPVCGVDYIWLLIDVMPSSFCSRTTARQVTWFMEHLGFSYSSAQLKIYLTQAQKAAKSFSAGASYDFNRDLVTPIKHLPYESDSKVAFPSRYAFYNKCGFRIEPDTPFANDYRSSLYR